MLMGMKKRMQVLFDEAEYAKILRLTRRKGVPLAEWVRESLRAALREEPGKDTERKLAAIRAAARLKFPVGDIDGMLAEIEAGYAEEAKP